MWNWVRYFGVEYVKTLMDSSQSQSIASENKSFSSSVSSGTDAPNSSEGVTCKAQFRSSEPLSVSVVLAKKKILKVLEEGSSDVSKVSFSILRGGKLGIDTNCSTTAVILRAVPFLEEIGRQCKGVCYLEASQSCTEAEILEELQQGNETITNVEKLKGNTCIITFATSIPSFILYFSGRCDVKSYYSSPYRCRKCQAFGHLGSRCKQKARCGNCSQLGHFAAYCTNAANCRTCRAPHRPDSVRCPRWQQEIRIKKHMASTGVTYTLAKQEVNVSGPRSSVVGGASAASKPPSLKPTWAKVAAKSVGTMRPKNVATQTKCFASVGSQCPDLPVLTAEISTQTESSESATPELQEVSVQSETAVLVVEPSMVGGQQSVESVEAVLPHSVSMPSLSCDGVTPIRSHMFSQDSIYSPQHEMEYTSASTRRKRCDSAESQDNPKKFAASSDCSYSPPPAAKPFKINRQFGNSQVDGIDDDDLSVSGGEFLAECSPFLVDRCVFSMGSGDEGDGHLDDHDLLSSASCETVQGDISGCSGVEEVPSPSSASPAGSEFSIQSGDPDSTVRLAVESIISEIVPVLEEHTCISDVAHQQLLEYIRWLVTVLAKKSAFDFKQISSLLRESLPKFEGRVISECREDLLAEISTTLFNFSSGRE